MTAGVKYHSRYAKLGRFWTKINLVQLKFGCFFNEEVKCEFGKNLPNFEYPKTIFQIEYINVSKPLRFYCI